VRAAVVTADEARAQLTDAGLGDRTSDVDLRGVFGGLLDRWETENDMVVLGAPAADSRDGEARAWTEFCLRSADRAVIVIGPEDRSDAWAESAHRMRSQLPSRPDLCFLGTREPSMVAGWLDALSPRAHHFVRTETARDAEETVGRMIRRVTGRSVGVVLSGGGARGFCHLGVLAAFRAAGIPIDRVGGCSIGAIIAALFASDHSDEESVEICRRFFVSSNPLNDYVLPRTALLRGRKLRASLRAALGLGPIEVLTLPYYCTSADLVRAETVVHRRGPLWKAVLASVSIPGLLPPVPVGEQLLVDGGVLNNLPIDVMADTDEGPVVAVDVMRPFTGRRAAPATRSLRSRRRAPDAGEGVLPAIAEILTRVSVLGSWRAVEQSRPRAILTITVPDTGTGMLEWNRLDAMVEVGRHAAEAALQGPASAQLRAAVGSPPPQ
jgi:NTE family protein